MDSPALLVHDAQRGAGAAVQQRRDAVARFGVEGQRRRMARREQVEVFEPRVDAEGADRGEDVLVAPLAHEHALHDREHLGSAVAGEGERAPGDAQFHAQRGLVRAVAADVADDGAQRAVGHDDQVVEVAAEQRATAAGPVGGVAAQVAVADEQIGQQPAFEPGVLAGLQFGLGAVLVGLVAFDRVADRAGQQRAVDLALVQVVLRARRDGLHAAVLVVEAGQHDDGGGRHQPEHAPQPVEATRVGQVEIQQHAPRRVGAGALGHPLRLAEVPRTAERDRRVRLGQQLADEVGVAVVVLHEQDDHGRLAGDVADGGLGLALGRHGGAAGREPTHRARLGRGVRRAAAGGRGHTRRHGLVGGRPMLHLAAPWAVVGGPRLPSRTSSVTVVDGSGRTCHTG